MEQKSSYSVLVSAVNILFATKMSMKKNESSWQRGTTVAAQCATVAIKF